MEGLHEVVELGIPRFREEKPMKPYLRAVAVRKPDISNCRAAASETVQT